MIGIEFIALGVILLFLYINIGWTQKIYYKGNFTALFLLSFAIPVLTMLLAKNGEKLVAVNFGLIILNYSWLLRVIKKLYPRLNGYLIQKKLVDSSFADKDFTYVMWDGDNATAGKWWDEKRAAKPSWLDHLITMILLVLPIAFTFPFTYFK